MNLDQPNKFQELDENQVYESVISFIDQCTQAWNEARAITFSEDYKRARNIVVCGMGGSRFTPLALKFLFKDKLTVPYEIVDDYQLPEYVDSDSLVILSSYSGSTEEVLSCAHTALKKGAKITAVAMGGEVQEFIKTNSLTGYFFNPKANPSNQPRIGSGYMLFGHLGLLHRLGYLPLDENDILGSINKIGDYSERYKKDLPEAVNPAKKLAQDLKGKHVFLVTSEFLRGFGNGFANQLNETAKNISDPRFLPELNHHLLEGLKYPETLRENGLFIFITSDLYSEPVRKRFAITKEVVEKNLIKTLEVQLTASSKLDQLLEAFTLSGFTTYYLAMLGDLDPVAIPWVDYFKEQLKN